MVGETHLPSALSLSFPAFITPSSSLTAGPSPEGLKMSISSLPRVFFSISGGVGVGAPE